MTTASVLSSILEWGKSRPKWQQSAMQMLYESPTLGSKEVAALMAMCKKEHGASEDDIVFPELTFAGDASVASAPNCILLELKDVVNANALRPGQSLTFNPKGITLVFGDNGAGKSGYVRILKQVCRARGDRDGVVPNAFVDDQPSTSATIVYEDGTDDPHPYVWSPGANPPQALAQVSILDSRAALVYTDGDQEVAYLPLGLDLFLRLANLCDIVSQELTNAVSKEKSARDLFLDFREGTTVRASLNGIHLSGARETLAKLRRLTPGDMESLATLRSEVAALRAGDVESRAKELELKAQRLESVRERLAKVARSTSTAAETSITDARARVKELSSAAKAATDNTFKSFPLQGLSDQTWKILWEAAREFATQGAKPTQDFPPKRGALCVLCQQPIDAVASQRLGAFEAFIGQSIATTLTSANKAVDSLLSSLRMGLEVAPIEASVQEEMDALIPKVGTDCAGHLSVVRARGTALLDGNGVVPPLPTQLNTAIEQCQKTEKLLTDQAAALRAASDPAKLRDREAALGELEARLRLDTAWSRVTGELARWERIRRLEACEASTRTVAITNKGKELLATAVTAPLADRFLANVTALALNYVPVEFAPAKGRKGTAVHHVRLASKTPVSPGDILSEGENRAIAIASFLAEVQVQASASSLVFDDPVSSLDLGRREYVAKALVKLAAKRPVVVFTHDMPFAWQITQLAEENGVQAWERQLRRGSAGAGIVANAITGSGQPARKRIGPLEQRANDLKKVSANDPESYEREARLIYNELRETWERAVEDVLLNGAVRRFGNEVKTQSLKKLHLVTEQHMKTLEEGMSKCSALMYGHDQPTPLGRPIPEPPELLADVQKCKNWMSEVGQLVK